jgi:hypothetical protein
LQQSVATAQELPAPLQVETDDAHLPAARSQLFVQHCASVVHAAPVTVQMTLVPPPPPVPVLRALTLLPPQPANATAMAASARVT